MIGWSVLTFLVGLILGAITLYYTRKQVRRREIAYEIKFHERLLSPGDSLRDHVQILFEGQVVPDVGIMLIRIWNSGNESITRDDYEMPITVNFETAKILGVQILSTIPPNLKVIPKLATGRRLELPRMMLNGGDSVFLKVLLTGPIEDPRVEARIKGVKQPAKREYRYDPPYLRIMNRCVLGGTVAYLPFYLADATIWGPVGAHAPPLAAYVELIVLVAWFLLLGATVCIRVVRAYRRKH